VQKDYNLGLAIVSGIDAQLNYRFNLPGNSGSINTSFNGTYLLHDTFTPYPGAGAMIARDCSVTAARTGRSIRTGGTTCA